jgi:glycerol-3-phosphate acyltransferase PlsY
MILAWTIVSFVAGSLPFSVWLGRLALHTDVRRYGDHNPGATNAWKAGGWRLGLPALVLDFSKGAVPVGLAKFGAGLSGGQLVPIALAPVLGHAFSPFLRFRGGKALAVTFGVWTGLTLAEGPIVLGILLGLLLALQDNDGWAVVLGMLAFGGYWYLRQADTFLMIIWAGNWLILTWKNRLDPRHQPHPRPWIANLLRRTE